MKGKFIALLTLIMLLSLVVTACGGADETDVPVAPTTAPPTSAPVVEAGLDCMGAEGETLTVFSQWSGAEEESLLAIFAPLLEECGIEIVNEASRDLAVLDARVNSDPPDLLFWPDIAPLNLYTNDLQDLDAVGADATSYASFWLDFGTVSGRWLAVPVKADIKTIIWYSPVQFDAFGYDVPTTFEDLETLVEQMVSDGNVPWSMGMESGSATGWTGSDFVQDVMLVQQGPEFVNGLIAGSVSYDDPGVVEAYTTYQAWASDPAYTVGGGTGTVNTGFLNAIYKPFSDPPEAMMVKQSGFAGGVVTEQFPDLEYGIDFDFFAFPGAQGMQGGADFLMAFGDSTATQAALHFLTGPDGGAAWAEAGFDLSPNRHATGNYADTQLAKKGDALAGASGFTFDLGDAIGAPFNTAEWKAVVDTALGGDIESALAGAAAGQRDSLALAPKIDCMGAAAGDTLNVFSQWSGAEEESILTILAPFVDECGIEIVNEASRDLAVLDARVKSDPPDVLFWPDISPLTLYPDLLEPLDGLGANVDNYAGFWVDTGTAGGNWFAVPVKADIKTIVWYSPITFETFGYAVPTSFADLEALVDQMVADGNIPWSMGMESGDATGWTGSDFVQDVLLAQQGPDFVNGIISGNVAYDDPGVVSAYETYVGWASSETFTVGGGVGTLNTGFLEAIYKPFSDPPEAMMVKQSGFAGGVVTEQFPDLEYGTDFDFFAFPGAQGMQGGADFMMAFGDSPVARAVVSFLTSAEGGTSWARSGFDLSPNSWAVGKYTDPQLAKKAEALAAAAGFTFDMGDAIGAPFNTAEWKALVDTIQGEDIATALAAAAAAQVDALQ
jgi:alpha-glucoside transport system substrate-binding protein